MTTVCRSVLGIRHKIAALKSQGKTVGFVPTMGALHEGHASLLSKARELSDAVVCSIYANPTQFDNKQDLKNYPRTEKSDLEILTKEDVDLAFIPIHDDIYHLTEVQKVNYGTLTNTLEGEHRPGHFDGMTTIVRRLFDVVNPDFAFFGEKDFQQLAIINHMNETEGLEIEIIGCQIIRETDGLAMSSRNIRLSPIERECALSLSKSIPMAAALRDKMTPSQVQDEVCKHLKRSGLNPDYVKIVQIDTLQEIVQFGLDKKYRLLMAAYAGETRLIDNGLV